MITRCSRPANSPSAVSCSCPRRPRVWAHRRTWLAYITVDDVDAAVQQATKLGARVLAPAMDIPKIGRFAVLADPQGAVFAPFKGEGDSPSTGARAPGYAWHELG